MKKNIITLMFLFLISGLVACGNLNVENATGNPDSINEVITEETVLLDEEDFKITLDDDSNKYEEDNVIMFSTKIINRTGKDAVIHFKDVKINGKTIPFTEEAERRLTGNSIDSSYDLNWAFLEIPFQSLYAANIKTVKKVSFTLEVYSVKESTIYDVDELLYSKEVTFETT